MCILCTQEHKTTTLLYGKTPVEIDNGLVDLMTQVWRLAIDTDGSCEASSIHLKLGLSGPPLAYVGCASKVDAVRFLRAAAGPDIAKELVTFTSPDVSTELKLSNGWTVQWVIFNSSYMVNFPPEEIGEITRRLQEIA